MGGIPISKYISIQTKTISAGQGTPDSSCLVFSTDQMTGSGSIVTSYNNGEVITLSKNGVADYFADSTNVFKFANKYFGHNNLVDKIHVRKILTVEGNQETCIKAYTDATNGFNNFGTVTFLGKDASDVEDVADAVNGTDYALIVRSTVDSAESDSEHFAGNNNVFLVVGDALICNTFASWYAGVNYNVDGASDSIDYKEFAGEEASVTTADDKDALDQLNVNYIGKVQGRGIERKFMQCGVMMNGEDAGVFRDKKWISYLIENGWFNLNNDRVVPASADGLARFDNMIVSVVNRAKNAKAILLDKPLDEKQITDINLYANDETASEKVASEGFYLSSSIVNIDNRPTITYVLIYAKGDHIGKVEGLHVLV